MNATSPLIVCVAPNGSRPRKESNPAVPYTPAEIAAEIIAAARAGAAMAHVHARKPDGSPTQDPKIFREIVERVREQSDIILELSLGSYGFSTEDAIAPLALRPAMASFPMEVRKATATGSMTMTQTAQLLLQHGVRPSLAITSDATRAEAEALIANGLAGPVPCIAVAPEASDSVPEMMATVLSLTGELPKTANWWLMKGGNPTHQLALRACAIACGGHIRVGFEDTLRRYDTDEPAPSNAWFVERVAALATHIGRQLATPAQARTILQLGTAASADFMVP